MVQGGGVMLGYCLHYSDCVCLHDGLGRIGIPSRMYFHSTPSIPSLGYRLMVSLMIKQLLNMIVM